jgi:Ku protein
MEKTTMSINHRLRPAENGHAAVALAPTPHGRPSWSGLLRISLVAVPVKAYPAVSSSATASHFHFLHADCGQRIQYQKHCRRHGAVPADAVVRGYEYAPGQYLVMEVSELEQLRPARDKALVLEQFVPVGDIDPTFYAGRSLYLLPDGAAAQHPYGVLAEAMQQAGQGVLGRVVFWSQRIRFQRVSSFSANSFIKRAYVLFQPAQPLSIGGTT